MRWTKRVRTKHANPCTCIESLLTHNVSSPPPLAKWPSPCVLHTSSTASGTVSVIELRCELAVPDPYTCYAAYHVMTLEIDVLRVYTHRVSCVEDTLNYVPSSNETLVSTDFLGNQTGSRQTNICGIYMCAAVLYNILSLLVQFAARQTPCPIAGILL